MNFQQLNYVTQICKYRSFNEAAKALFVSQPTLSRSIKSLENELGIVIFNRTNLGISLTPEGERFINSVNAVVQQLNYITAYNLKNEEPMSVFRVTSMSSSFAAESFVKFCEFYANEDAYRFRFNIAEPHKVVNEVLHNYCDLGVLFLGGVYQDVWKNFFEAKKIDYYIIGKLNMSVLISRKDPLAKQKVIDLEALRDYCFVRNYLRDKETPDELFLDYYNLINNTTQNKAILSYDREITYQLISRTKAYTLAYNHQIDYAKRFDLTCIPLSSTNITTEVGFLSRSYDELDALSLKYIEIMKNELATGGVLKPDSPSIN